MNYRMSGQKSVDRKIMDKRSRILAQYQITYEVNGFVQEKHLVSRGDWDEVLIPIKREIYDMDNRGNKEESKLLKNVLKLMFGNIDICFPEGGPLHESITTGFISLPPDQGGQHKVLWKKN